MRNVYLKKPDPIVRIKTYSSKASAVAAEKLVAKDSGTQKGRQRCHRRGG